ncbi:hopanoid biosynthesis-associated protein HpnK [Acidithiobacillus ferrooxidans]|uniref:hopanoid biosynthesis-associated protein HpnK n=1 Tax=Acidithiobacillus ferrooxidans TaxID=920 RepID=UPI0013D7A76C|nr:hopanoid biosynthesis-associated protein HpnK [Acidithiobacillus ferrooxidans]MCR2829317.1 hopanoid biosynthesis-associated protein HpnK [Acidithiobacillus ferrooxidans]
MGQGGGRRVIFNADDFGLDMAVNEAVESAHRDGVLTTASLMVAAPAAADAVARARALPGLGVGLHLTLVDGTPLLPAEQVPDLVDEQGRFAADLWRRGVRYFFLPQVRKQLAAEIRAQFAAFAATGLELDHANAHKHLHLHPTVLTQMLEVGKEFGLRAVRLPWEPLRAARCSGAMGVAPAFWSIFLAPWLARMRRQLDRRRIMHNDQLYGLDATGHMDEERLLRMLCCLPAAGVTEIYLHPAMVQTAALHALMPNYEPHAEWAALTSPRVKDYLRDQDIAKGTFRDFVAR